MMRRILIERARRKLAAKRGGRAGHLDADEIEIGAPTGKEEISAPTAKRDWTNLPRRPRRVRQPDY
ncbi:MAG: hypothetical protein KDN20_05530 [Verrucomicrobiae bacterium]|nr:hypothetical protein [Verrucomicrobiae bacterium]